MSAPDVFERSGSMEQIKEGDQVLGMAPDRDTVVEVFKVVKVAGDGIQVRETSGKLSKAELRAYDDEIFQKIQEKERQVKALKHQIRELYKSLKTIE
jgi:hypothetical protein